MKFWIHVQSRNVNLNQFNFEWFNFEWWNQWKNIQFCFQHLVQQFLFLCKWKFIITNLSHDARDLVFVNEHFRIRTKAAELCNFGSNFSKKESNTKSFLRWKLPCINQTTTTTILKGEWFSLRRNPFVINIDVKTNYR
jgi:hypothetical protein